MYKHALTPYLRNFALKKTQITAVYTGVVPENQNEEAYYFLTKSPRYNKELEDEVSDRCLKILEETNLSCHIFILPLEHKKIKDINCIKHCIYKKD